MAGATSGRCLAQLLRRVRSDVRHRPVPARHRPSAAGSPPLRGGRETSGVRGLV